MKLLSTNTKLEKIPNAKKRYLVRGLSMAPHTMSGRNLCPWAAGCAAVCVLWFAGRTVMQSVRDAMIRRAKLFFEAYSDPLKRLIDAVVLHLDSSNRSQAYLQMHRLHTKGKVPFDEDTLATATVAEVYIFELAFTGCSKNAGSLIAKAMKVPSASYKLQATNYVSGCKSKAFIVSVPDDK